MSDQHHHETRLEMFNCVVDQLISERDAEEPESRRVAKLLKALMDTPLSYRVLAAIAAVAIDRLASA